MNVVRQYYNKSSDCVEIWNIPLAIRVSDGETFACPLTGCPAGPVALASSRSPSPGLYQQCQWHLGPQLFRAEGKAGLTSWAHSKALSQARCCRTQGSGGQTWPLLGGGWGPLQRLGSSTRTQWHGCGQTVATPIAESTERGKLVFGVPPGHAVKALMILVIIPGAGKERGLQSKEEGVSLGLGTRWAGSGEEEHH